MLQNYIYETYDNITKHKSIHGLYVYMYINPRKIKISGCTSLKLEIPPINITMFRNFLYYIIVINFVYRFILTLH